jgi:hypothetical protein
MRELREGTVAEMVARIAREHTQAAGEQPQADAEAGQAPEVAEAPRAQPRRPGRLFPDAPDVHG